MTLRLFNAPKCSGKYYIQTLWSERQPGLEIKKPTIRCFLFLEQIFLHNDNYPMRTTVAFDPIIINICEPSKNMCICVTSLGHAGKIHAKKPMNDESKPKRPKKSEMPKKKCSFFVILLMFVPSQTNLSCIFLSITSQSK